ncbi:enolase [Chelatococcus sp. GCM10030263]|uniref:enolase n=1 Tax=Chelatococcus sp. GCM10030263 TaxID=3273387 RepID=UPI003617F091
MALRVRLDEIAAFERATTFRRAFRFGAVTVREAPQAFIRIGASTEDGRSTTGVAAEMMMPKWFDKDPAKTPAETIADLKSSLAGAVEHYRRDGSRFDTAFGHHALVYPRQMDEARRAGLPRLAAAFGPALLDKAVADAVLKLAGLDFAAGLRANLLGLDNRFAPDLAQGDLARFLGAVDPMPEVALRHTIGFVDDLDELGSEVAAARLRYFKVKLSGDVQADRARLRSVTVRLTALVPDFRASLDANEQYDPARLALLLAALADDPVLSRLKARLLHIEQPLDRAATFAHPLGELADEVPFIIDEADDGYDAFPRAVALGYRGVSSKACKGLYKSLVNGARAAAWNARDRQPGHFFVTGEDLTCQAGLGVQQDTALVACLGITHGERNGHHYVDGFGPAPAGEAEGFMAAVPGFYARYGGRAQLAVASGVLTTASLFTPGFASGAAPDWSSLAPLMGAVHAG